MYLFHALDSQHSFFCENFMNVRNLRAKVTRHIYVTCFVVTLALIGIYQTNSYEGDSERQVNLFDEMAYQSVLALKGIDDSLCSLVTGLRPNYVVCKYNPREDWISHNIAMSKSYEPKMSQRFLEMVKESGAEAENTAFVDCGVNIGVHSLFMAVNGVRIFGVDPLEENLLHVFHAAKKNRVQSRVTLFQNGVDMVRRKVFMKTVKGNVGANFLSSPTEHVGNATMKEADEFETILLSDVFEAVYVMSRYQHDSKPLLVLLKMDIEQYECRAILGSPGIFSDPRFNITAISIEWNYVLKGGKISDLCPSNDLKRLVKFLVENSFEPTEYKSGRKLDPRDSHKWGKGTHVFWKKKFNKAS